MQCPLLFQFTTLEFRKKASLSVGRCAGECRLTVLWSAIATDCKGALLDSALVLATKDATCTVPASIETAWSSSQLIKTGVRAAMCQTTHDVPIAKSARDGSTLCALVDTSAQQIVNEVQNEARSCCCRSERAGRVTTGS